MGKGQVSSYTFSQASSTYTAITGGTVVATATSASDVTASLDDVVYNLPSGTIPFTFTFNGTGYTGLNISTNGFVTFGSTGPATNDYSPLSSTATYAGAIAAFGRDNNALFNISGNTGEIRYQTLGATPNRQFVIQYKNFRPYSTSTLTTPIWRWNYQIVLNENGNTIDVIYDANFVGVPTSTTAQVGLRGANNTFPGSINNRSVVSGTNTWATSAAGTSNTSVCNLSTTLIPVSGQKYSWAPPVVCSGTPTAGNAIAGTNPICAGSSSLLSLSGATSASGITYQW